MALNKLDFQLMRYVDHDKLDVSHDFFIDLFYGSVIGC